MAIATLDQYLAATKQRIAWWKQTSVTTALAGCGESTFGTAGQPGAGTLAGAATGSSTPIMPTDATPGCPIIAFSSGTGYLTRVEISNSVAGRVAIYDMLSKSGAYAYNSGTSTPNPRLDISSHCPDYSGGGDTAYGINNEIWIEVVTAMTNAATWQVQVTYYNQAGSLSTSVVSVARAAGALTIGTCFQIGLASGDTGVQSIASVIVTTGSATAGTFNVLILRPLFTCGRVQVVNDGEVFDLVKTGMPVVYNNSALYVMIAPDSTATGLPHIIMEIASA